MICTISLSFEIDFLEFPLEVVFGENSQVFKNFASSKCKIIKRSNYELIYRRIELLCCSGKYIITLPLFFSRTSESIKRTVNFLVTMVSDMTSQNSRNRVNTVWLRFYLIAEKMATKNR